MARIRIPAFLCAAFLLVLVLSVGEVSAVPSFARKYRTSCATCHNVYPQLNSFGRLYRAKGYRMPGKDERFVRDAPVPLGDSTADRLWPHALRSSDIPGGSVAAPGEAAIWAQIPMKS